MKQWVTRPVEVACSLNLMLVACEFLDVLSMLISEVKRTITSPAIPAGVVSLCLPVSAIKCMSGHAGFICEFGTIHWS